MKTFMLAVLQSALTAIYWWGAVTVSYGLFGGSRNPDLPAVPESTLMMQTYGTIAVAIVIYAILLVVWWRVTGCYKASLKN